MNGISREPRGDSSQQRSHSGTPSSPSNSSISPSSFPSQNSISSQSASRPIPNLPPPPPADRMPPPKGRSNKFKINRKGKAKGHDRKGSTQLEDDWTLEGPPNGNGIAAESSQRYSSELGRPSSRDRRGHLPRGYSQQSSRSLYDSQLTAVPPSQDDRKEKKSIGRGLAKKTSQLFSRSGRDKSQDTSSSHGASHGNASLNLPSTSRQTSYSSATSGESQSTTGSTRHPFAALHRPSSHHSQTRYPRSNHSRRLSQDSANSWQNSRSMRSGSISTHDSPTDLQYLPIPQRQSSHLSASVPTLSRQALPQPLSSAQEAAGGLPSRMSTWFSHLIPTNSTATVPAPPPTETSSNPSPIRRPPSAAASFLNAARQRAVDGVRHLLDSEAAPDKCPDTMWVMGVAHPGWRPVTPTGSPGRRISDLPANNESQREAGMKENSLSASRVDPATLRRSSWKRKEAATTSPPARGFGIFSASSLSLALPAAMSGSPSRDNDPKGPPADSPSKARKMKNEKEVLKWPDLFYDDFRSRVWCTYRSQYAPILSLPPSLLIPSPEAYFSAFGPALDATSSLLHPHANSLGGSTQPSTSPWMWPRSADEKGLTSDSGWGCMLRTGQSMLANALISLHLGRGWRLPPETPSSTPQSPQEAADLDAYATYVRLISWFLDDPSPLCPFSVHRMALIGKELGKEVGEWFGPSTAAGALKTLGNSFPLCGLAVTTATDSIVYKSDVYTASKISSDGWTDEVRAKRSLPNSASTRNSLVWGGKAVLILIGIRLGLDGVNPIYYESIKTLFTFPQSVGIAGGRPSSSYYFVACQANSLFYLDPHLTRPAIPLETPPAPAKKVDPAVSRLDDPPTGGDPVVVERSAGLAYILDVVDVDDLSSDIDSDDSMAPARRRVRKSSPAARRLSAPRSSRNPETPPRLRHANSHSISDPFSPVDPTPKSDRSSMAGNAKIGVDPQSRWYVNAYSEAQLRTFHCDKVKKMPISGMDPSMLLGFLCKHQSDFEDFCERVSRLPQKIFTVQEEPPSWGDDDETGLESVSEPDLDDLADDVADTHVSESEEEEFDNADVSSMTVGPIQIPSKSAYTAPRRSEDDEWDTGLDRGTPSSQPIFVERPSDETTRRPEEIWVQDSKADKEES